MDNGPGIPIVWSGVLSSLVVEQNHTNEGQTLFWDETGPAYPKLLKHNSRGFIGRRGAFKKKTDVAYV